MNIQEVKELIVDADACGHVPLIKGLHGIGKSEAPKQYAKENGMHFEPLILSLMDTGDLLGLPDDAIIGGLKSTIWEAPSWYTNIVNAAWPPKMPLERLRFLDKKFEKFVTENLKSEIVDRGELNKMLCTYYFLAEDRLQLVDQEAVEYLDAVRSVLLLDEFNRCNQDILNAALQLILDNRLHNHVLPRIGGKPTLIIASINPPNGDYQVQEFDPALLDRFLELEVEPDLSAWVKWARENNVNKTVIEFLVANPKKFHFTPEDMSKGTSARTWTRISKYIDLMQDSNRNPDVNYVKGTVGPATAALFLNYYSNRKSMVSLEDLEDAIGKEVMAVRDNGQVPNPEAVSAVIESTVKKLEPVQRADFCDLFLKKYVEVDTFMEAMPLLAYLYALPLENLSSALKSLQSSSMEQYAKLVKLDNVANRKKLFKKVVAGVVR